MQQVRLSLGFWLHGFRLRIVRNQPSAQALVVTRHYPWIISVLHMSDFVAGLVYDLGASHCLSLLLPLTLIASHSCWLSH